MGAHNDKMSMPRFFTEMERLGYPMPTLYLWVDDGRKKAEAVYVGSPPMSSGDKPGTVYETWEDAIGAVFKNVTGDGQPYEPPR